MRLKTPHFWYQKKGIGAKGKAILLSPFSLIYNAGHALNQNLGSEPYKTKIPVLCIGNLVAGGSGKTPSALAIMTLINKKRLFDEPVFLSRGYKGTEKGPLLINPDTHKVEETGDEPLLLARTAKTVIAKNRMDGAIHAQEQAKADLIIMDDGLQNKQLEKTLNIAVIDGKYGFGNSKTLPAGPLRETLSQGFDKVDAFILIGNDERNIKQILPKEKPVFEAIIKVPDDWICDREVPYVAFAGMGQPEKFHSTLWDKGLNVVGWHAYPDHHQYTENDLKKLAKIAKDKGARLITTEKDAVRLPAAFKNDVTLDIMPVVLEFKDEQDLEAYLKEKLKTEGSHD